MSGDSGTWGACCTGGDCCGAGSYCCGNAGEHEHEGDGKQMVPSNADLITQARARADYNVVMSMEAELLVALADALERAEAALSRIRADAWDEGWMSGGYPSPNPYRGVTA